MSFVRKIAVAAAVGAFVLAGTSLTNITFVDGLVLSLLVGFMVLAIEFLQDVESRTRAQTRAINDLREQISSDLNRLTEASVIWTAAQKSAIPPDLILKAVRRTSAITEASPEIARGLAAHEIERLSSLLRGIGGSNEIFYDGEDREWLLGLTSVVVHSIDAVSLATIDDRDSEHGNLWQNDLGYRYLDLQREAVARGVIIRRLFSIEGVATDDPGLIRVTQLQRESGVIVRLLQIEGISNHLRRIASDFVIFDAKLVYETVPASRMDEVGRAAIVTTRMLLDEARVRSKQEQFEQLWQAARELDEPATWPQ